MEHFTVQILGRDYRLSCEPAERETLLAAVAHVDASMHDVRDQARITGTERIAVFAALNIAGELLARDAAGDVPRQPVTDAVAVTVESPVADPAILRRMQDINALLDTALASQERLF